MFEKVRDMLAEALNISAEKITMDSNVIEDLGDVRRLFSVPCRGIVRGRSI